MPYYSFYILILAAMFSVARPFTVLFHELGHAIPAVLFTRRKTTIYIGSYGDPKKSIRLTMGLLVIYFRYNPFRWQAGLCVPSADNISRNRQIVYTLAGPISSLFIGIIACYFSFAYDQHGILKLFFVVFLCSALIDLLANLIPNNTPIILHDGAIAYNDGFTLKQLFFFKHFIKKYEDASSLYNAKRYAEAAPLFDKMISLGLKDENTYRLTIYCYLMTENYERLQLLFNELAQLTTLNANDFLTMAAAHSNIDKHEEAIDCYDRSLALEANNLNALNNKGYTFTLINRYKEAIPLFNWATELDNNFAYAYNNRGLSKIKSGEVEEGLKDIYYSLTLDSQNSYCYRNLGIYNFDLENYSEALRLFRKAKELDDKTYKIDLLINETMKLESKNS